MPTPDSPMKYVPTTGPVPRNLPPGNTFMHHGVKIGPAEALALLGAKPRAAVVPEDFPRHPKIIVVDANGEVAGGARELWELIRDGLGYTFDVFHNMPVGAVDRMARQLCLHMGYLVTTDDRVLLDAMDVIAWLKGAVVMGRNEPVVELLIHQLIEDLAKRVPLLRSKWQGPRADINLGSTPKPGRLSLVCDDDADGADR